MKDEFLLSHIASMRLGKDGKWRIRPGLQEWLWEDNLERFTALWRRPWDIPLFQRSMDQLDPKIALRDLQVPVLIIDSVNDQDYLPASSDNEALTRLNPNLVRHVVYETHRTTTRCEVIQTGS